MTMPERQARQVAGLLSTLDELSALRKALGKKGREFYICAQGEDECLYSGMRLPADSGIAFVEMCADGIRKKLVELGVIADPATE